MSMPKIMLLNSATIGSKSNSPIKIANRMERSATSIVEVAKTFIVSVSVPLVSKYTYSEVLLRFRIFTGFENMLLKSFVVISELLLLKKTKTFFVMTMDRTVRPIKKNSAINESRTICI